MAIRTLSCAVKTVRTKLVTLFARSNISANLKSINFAWKKNPLRTVIVVKKSVKPMKLKNSVRLKKFRKLLMSLLKVWKSSQVAILSLLLTIHSWKAWSLFARTLIFLWPNCAKRFQASVIQLVSSVTIQTRSHLQQKICLAAQKNRPLHLKKRLLLLPN